MPRRNKNAPPLEQSGVAALDRAFSILRAFHGGESVALVEIARRTGLYKSTILRLLGSLEVHGFVRRDADGRYSVGPEPLRLAQIYQDGFHVRPVIQPLLHELSHELGETASFYVRDGKSRVVLHRVEPSRSLRFTLREGERFPVEFGASGKVLIAFGGDHPGQLEAVRRRLWAISHGERDPEITSIAVPVFGVGQVLQGALTVSGPQGRFTKDAILGCCRKLLQAAARATSSLGGNGSVFEAGLQGLTKEHP